MSESLSIDVTLDLGQAEAVEAVTEALKAQGFGVLTRIDVDTTLKEKIGAEFRPYTILGACNPPLAHKALSHNAEVGLMLPCNVTVEAAGEGQSMVRIANPDLMIQVGDFASDPVLQEVAEEAGRRLQAAAEQLRG